MGRLGGRLCGLIRRLPAILVVPAALLLVCAPQHAAASASPWTLVSSPDAGNSLSSNDLSAVACVTAADCWAAGHYGAVIGAENFTNQSLIEHWDGTAWSITPSGNENAGAVLQDNQLYGVACVDAAHCWAVGAYQVAGTGRTAPLWEFWNGTAWTPSTQAVAGDSSLVLRSVACVDASSCWAAGYRQAGTAAPVTLIERWDGTAWTDTASPSHAGRLNGIACAATVFCQAVGDTAGTPDRTLVEQWNGTAWAPPVSTPDHGAGANGLNAVSCVNTVACWAVGEYNDGTANQNLFLGWNGTAWTIPTDTAASNNNAPAERANQLAGVTCVSPSSCVAVGNSSSGPNTDTTLIDTWNGTTWTLVPNTPNRTTDNLNDLAGVSCVPNGFCAAAGSWQTGLPNDQTLIVSLAPPPPPPTATPTPTPRPHSSVSAATSRIPVPHTGGGAGDLLVAGAIALFTLGALGLTYAVRSKLT